MKNNFHRIYDKLLRIFYTFTYSQKNKYFSQYAQDRFINEKIFHGKNNGVFIDIGANDGKTISNTYYLEKELNWKGICIEPNPDIFKKLTSNRNCICIEGAISEKDGDSIFLQISGYSEPLSGLLYYYDPKHKERIQTELETHGGQKKEIVVKCYRLESILEQYKFNSIDYLSIDTEGGELAILKSIDFDKIKILSISVENVYYGRDIKNYLSKYGYKRISILGCDEIYLKENYLSV